MSAASRFFAPPLTMPWSAIPREEARHGVAAGALGEHLLRLAEIPPESWRQRG